MKRPSTACCRRHGGGGIPLSLTCSGESVAVLCCNTRDPDLDHHLSAMGVGQGAVLDVLGNENGRIMVLAGESRLGIDAELAKRIRVSPALEEHGRPHRGRCRGRFQKPCGCHNQPERSTQMKVAISAAALNKGQEGVVKQVKGDPAVNRRLRDMGLTPGARLRCEGKAPLGDPIELEIMGYRLTLRKSEAEGVLVEVDA